MSCEVLDDETFIIRCWQTTGCENRSIRLSQVRMVDVKHDSRLNWPQ